MSSSSKVSQLMLFLYVFMSSVLISALAGNFYRDFDILFGDRRAMIRNGGQILTLSLDKASGSGIRSKDEYLFGRIDMQIKLVRGNSAGTVTTYYLSSQGATHDEVDFEFLGNLAGKPYILSTNVYSQGKGNREQQFHLWFDPTKNFHTYSIIWSPRKIILMVDNIAIRVFNNWESIGVPFPKRQPMRIYSTIWNADDWATRGPGGEPIKTDWSKAPFTAFYRNFNADACVASSRFCHHKFTRYSLDPKARNKLRWVQKKFMIYDYCTDLKRFSQGLPPECKRSRFL